MMLHSNTGSGSSTALRATASVLVPALLCVAAACSGSSANGFGEPSSSGGTSGSSGTSGSDGSSGTSDSSGTSGVDGGPNDCVATSIATGLKRPVDIIVVIDQSGSMSEELMTLKASINNLSAALASGGIDYRVVMVGSVGTGKYEVCVPPPLGAAGCQSNGTKLRTVNAHVESTDALDILLSTVAVTSGPTMWRDFLRPEAEKIFVPITDDNASSNPAQWDADLLATGLFGTAAKRDYVFYPIVGSDAYPAETRCSTALNNGSVYLQLAKLTHGTWSSVCSTSFGPIFTAIGSTLGARSACELSISAAGGAPFDPTKVNLTLTSSDGKTSRDLVQETAGCASAADGWQYSADGKRVLLCGAACEAARSDPASKVSVEFGCATHAR